MEDLMKDWELKLVVSQEQDCTASGDDCNTLEIFTRDGGGGPYFILKTDRWAFDDPDEVIDIIKEFMEQYGRLQTEKE